MITLPPKELALLAINGFGAMQKMEEFEKLITLLESKLEGASAVLEIGAGNGGTSWTWNRMFESVTTIDLPNGPWGGSDLSKLNEYLPYWNYIEEIPIILKYLIRWKICVLISFLLMGIILMMGLKLILIITQS